MRGSIMSMHERCIPLLLLLVLRAVAIFVGSAWLMISMHPQPPTGRTGAARLVWARGNRSAPEPHE